MIGIHETLKTWTGAPEFSLDPAEAKSLAQAAAKVARWYKLPSVAEKSVDWMNLAMTLNAIYTPRVLAARMRRGSRSRSRPQPAPAPTSSPIPETVATPDFEPDPRFFVHSTDGLVQ